MKTLSAAARDALVCFEGDPSLERRFSGGDARPPEMIKMEITEVRRQIERVLANGATQVPESDPLNARIRALKTELAKSERGYDSLFVSARDALDAGGAVFEQDGGMWYCSWNGATYGPFPNRAAAMQRRMEVSSANANGRDSLADLVDRARGGIREQVGDAFSKQRVAEIISEFETGKLTKTQAQQKLQEAGMTEVDAKEMVRYYS